MASSYILRIVAIFVLLFAGSEMVLCEMTDSNETSHHEGGTTESSTASCHDCFCSGSHVVPAPVSRLSSSQLVVPAEHIHVPDGIDRPQLPVYHPPKA